MKTVTLAVSLFASLAMSLAAQAPKQDKPAPKTETVYTIQITGIRG